MDNCIFCKIAVGVIPSYTVFEDDKFKVFLDIKPVSVGHLLLITKDHYNQFEDLPTEILGDAFSLAQKLRPRIREALSADYVIMSVVGEEVKHFHIQFIPRKITDGLTVWPVHDLTAEAGKEQSELLKAKLKL